MVRKKCLPFNLKAYDHSIRCHRTAIWSSDDYVFDRHKAPTCFSIYRYDMSEQLNTSRRKAIKLLAGAPLLPLGVATTGLLGACGGTETAAANDGTLPPALSNPQASFLSAAFVSMAAPTLDDPQSMATTTVRSSLKVALSDGSSQTYKLAYQPFFMTGDNVPDGKGTDHTISITPREDGSYALSPWVFEGDSLEVSVEGRYITAQPQGTDFKAIFDR